MTPRCFACAFGLALAVLVSPVYERAIIVSAQTAPSALDDVARQLVQRAIVSAVPEKGKVVATIEKDSPQFTLTGGTTPVIAFRLPDYHRPYVITLTSFVRQGFELNHPIFVPTVVLLDAGFQTVQAWTEQDLKAARMAMRLTIDVDEAHKTGQYLMVFTTGEGGRIRVQGGSSASSMVGAMLTRVARSTYGRIEVQTKPTK
jgi:hypothetical protein